MFFVKEQISDSVEVKVLIHDDNVFCNCPSCGCEVGVDLSELFRDGDNDLYGTAVYCHRCSKREGYL